MGKGQTTERAAADLSVPRQTPRASFGGTLTRLREERSLTITNLSLETGVPVERLVAAEREGATLAPAEASAVGAALARREALTAEDAAQF